MLAPRQEACEAGMREWVAFWNAENTIYVSARHRDVHYRQIADDLLAHVPGPAATVLDYGCGEARHADRLAAAVGRLILSDAAPNVRAALASRFAGHPKIEVRSPEQVAAFPDASIDLIAMVSVAQYLAPDELDQLLALFRRLLKPQGQLVIADVVPSSVSPLTDAAALLRFAQAHGFLGAAILGLARTAFSDYRRLRGSVGLTLYDEAGMMAKLATAGYAARRAAQNVGHNSARMTFVAQPRA
jgi:ubiquinone/menaquinone biosynthesis C-methylase UbiE